MYRLDNADKYVRTTLAARVLWATCSPWTYCIYKYCCFTIRTARDNPQFCDEGQEKGVKGARRVSGVQNKVMTLFGLGCWRPRVWNMSSILRDMSDALNVGDAGGGVPVEVQGAEGFVGERALDRAEAVEDDAEAEADTRDLSRPKELFREPAFVCGLLFGMALGGTMDLTEPLRSVKALRVIEDGAFCSLFDGGALNLGVLAWPTLALERVAEYAAEAFPYFGPDAEDVRIVNGRVRGVLKRKREKTRFAVTPVDAAHLSLLDEFFLKQQTTCLEHEIRSYQVGHVHLFTKEMVQSELTELRDTHKAGTHATAVADLLPDELDIASMTKTELAPILAETRKRKIPCTPTLKARQPPPPVTQNADLSFERGGSGAFEPFEQRFVKNTRAASPATATFDLSQ